MGGAKVILLLAAALLGCGSGVTPGGADGGDENGGDAAVSFSGDVQGIFDAYCTANCHLAGGAASFLSLTSDVSYESLVNQPATRSDYSTGETTLVVPFDSSGSVLYKRISQTGTVDGEQRMPTPSAGDSLGASDQQLIKTWVDEGAENN
jgi:hypothetical protein